MIFLFMGGFLIAIAMQRWKLDRRIALLTLRVAGTRPANMVAGFMLTTAGLSAFVSNTATTAMMVPIALSVICLVRDNLDKGNAAEVRATSNLSLCLLLGIAYCRIVRGNRHHHWNTAQFLAGGIRPVDDRGAVSSTITFDQWLLIGVPVTVLFLPVAWLLLTRFLFRLDHRRIRGGGELIRAELQRWGG